MPSTHQCQQHTKKRAGTGIGTVSYNVTMNPRAVLNTLRLTYGRPTPEENDALESVWNQGWQPSEPIENLFLRLEECYITSLAFGVAYTIEQMTQKAFDAVRRTRLYQTAELEWQGFDKVIIPGENSRCISPRRTRQQEAMH